MYATVVLSQYFPDPRKGHITNIQHLYVYLNKYTSTSIKFNTEIHSYENFKTIEGKWGNFYDVEPAELPHSCPPTMIIPVPITSFVDENFMEDLSKGRYQTRIIHILNKTPIDWYYKPQSCV